MLHCQANVVRPVNHAVLVLLVPHQHGGVRRRLRRRYEQSVYQGVTFLGLPDPLQVAVRILT